MSAGSMSAGIGCPEARTNNLRLAAVAAEIGGREPTLVLHQVIDLLAAAGVLFFWPVADDFERAGERLAINATELPHHRSLRDIQRDGRGGRFFALSAAIGSGS